MPPTGAPGSAESPATSPLKTKQRSTTSRRRLGEIPIPRLVDDENWERAQKLKKQRSRRAKRNTKVLYLWQHLLRCGECGHNFHAKSTWRTTNVRNGKKYHCDLPTPRGYYMCNGMQSLRLRCRERPNIRVERLEEAIWREVKRVIQNPDLLVAGIDPLDSQESAGLEEQIAQAERDLRSIQTREDRAITLFVSGRITEAQLDDQCKFITERLEGVRAKLDDYHARAASGAEKARLVEAVFAWARDVGHGLDELTPEQRKENLQMVVEEVIVDNNDNVDITLGIPIESEPTTGNSVTVTFFTPSNLGSPWTCSKRAGTSSLSRWDTLYQFPLPLDCGSTVQ